ncbi:MAG: NAD(P)-binding domain-containing protein, partial [Epsilonproteobacteria bacterium]|nr:NAD(P)-binding domain-containing protein [Campylobacterota bacterium]
MEIFTQNITILGSGNIGSSIAKGFILSSMIKPEQIILTRRKTKLLTPFEKKGCIITDNNCEAVKKSDIIIIAVPPQQIKELLQQINSDLNPKKHIIISVVSGVTTEEILRLIKKQIQVVRAMPNIASAIRESMTCIASDTASSQTIEQAKKLFDYVGKTFIISEEQMVPATALGACGIAFFLRAIRAASQG